MAKRYEVGWDAEHDRPWRQVSAQHEAFLIAASKAARESVPIIVRDRRARLAFRVTGDGAVDPVPFDPGQPEPVAAAEPVSG